MRNHHLLFQAEFHYGPNIPPVELHDNSSRSGELLGSGDGVVGGAILQGRVHWSLFEVQGPICETNIVGVITTDDGAQLEFETRGYGVVPDPNQAHLWEMPAGAKFWPESPGSTGLNPTLARGDETF